MKRKVKKFGRGGDIVTGIGAALIGKALYDKYKEGKGSDKDDDYTRRVKEYGIKGKFPEEKSEEKAAPKREDYVPADKDELDAKRRALSEGMQYKTPEGPAAVDTSNNAAKNKNVNKNASTDSAPAPTGSDSTRSSAGDVIDAGIRNARIGRTTPAVKKAPSAHQNFLSSKAGLSGKGIPTPGDKNKTEATSKVAKAVQGTIDNRSKSMARTPEQKMSEGAREVQRRRDKEKAEKLGYGIKKGGMVKKYASGGSVKRSASSRADGIAIRGKTRA